MKTLFFIVFTIQIIKVSKYWKWAKRVFYFFKLINNIDTIFNFLIQIVQFIINFFDFIFM